MFLFQSTLPVWGATQSHCHSEAEPQFQSTLPVWGATIRPTSPELKCRISIHAPRVGSDFTRLEIKKFWVSISIHAPRVGSDRRSPLTEYIITISIHAPRVGSDFASASAGACRGISIHAPRVGSDNRRQDLRKNEQLFQSTLPVWGATAKMHRFFFCIFCKKGVFL